MIKKVVYFSCTPHIKHFVTVQFILFFSLLCCVLEGGAYSKPQKL